MNVSVSTEASTKALMIILLGPNISELPQVDMLVDKFNCVVPDYKTACRYCPFQQRWLESSRAVKA